MRVFVLFVIVVTANSSPSAADVAANQLMTQEKARELVNRANAGEFGYHTFVEMPPGKLVLTLFPAGLEQAHQCPGNMVRLGYFRGLEQRAYFDICPNHNTDPNTWRNMSASGGISIGDFTYRGPQDVAELFRLVVDELYEHLVPAH